MSKHPKWAQLPYVVWLEVTTEEGITKEFLFPIDKKLHDFCSSVMTQRSVSARWVDQALDKLDTALEARVEAEIAEATRELEAAKHVQDNPFGGACAISYWILSRWLMFQLRCYIRDHQLPKLIEFIPFENVRIVEFGKRQGSKLDSLQTSLF